MNSLKSKKQLLALLIPAHNEEMVLAETIRGALATGIAAKDIFLVDDSSADRTYDVAVGMLGVENVLRVERAGKALALKQALNQFDLPKRYKWIQIIDADSIFSPNYFIEIKKHFKPHVAAVCGQVKSLQNNWITSYRAYEYTVFQDFYKTLQSRFNLVGVMPGPATCFRSSVLKRLKFSSDTLTEDFDMTIQVHRRKMGRIVYVGSAFSWTQDPPTLSIYIKQINRWYTGFFQVMKKYRVGTRLRGVDVMLLFQTLDGFFYVLQLVTISLIMLLGVRYIDVKLLLVADFITLFILSLYTAFRMRRVDILTPMPLYYFLRLICVIVFLWAAIKVFILPKSRTRTGLWNTSRINHQQTVLQAVMKGGEI